MDVLDLKMSWPKKILLGLGLWLASSCGVLAMILVQDSNVFQDLKKAKLIDKLTATITTLSIPVPSFFLSLLILSVLVNFVLYKRIIFYKESAEKFVELFSKALIDISIKTKHPINIKFGIGNLLITPDGKSNLVKNKE